MESENDSPIPIAELDMTEEDIRNFSSNFDIELQRYQSGFTPRRKDMSFDPDESSREWRSGLSPMHDSADRYKIENNQLKLQNKQLQMDLQSEQDTVSSLRKRLNTVERDRLEAASKANNEVSELESQLAKLRAQLEKGEASRANLEFELTRSRRDISQHKHTFAEKESTLQEVNEELKHKLTDYGDEIKRLEEQLQQDKAHYEEVERKFQREMELKDLEISKCATEQEVLQAERDKLDAINQQQENSISDLNEKVQDLEAERRNQTENLRRTMSELEYGKEREDRIKKDLESSLERLRTLEESVESERAAHLETKFNSEIVQLRVKDLEGALEVEKSANNEANKAIDRLSKQIRELEHTLEDERNCTKQVTEKLHRVEKEYSTTKKQLTSEVENKKNVIGSLSKELEIHQKNFMELKEELAKARKRQIYLEETYGGSMRELELLLQNFQIEDKSKKQRSKKESAKTLAPSLVLENLRVTLTEYRKRSDHMSQELSKMKKQSDGLNKEIDQCKEMIWAKDKALEDAQKNYTRTAKELNRVRSEYGELEGLLTRLKVDFQSTANNQSKDRLRIQELSEEIMKLVKKHKGDEEEKLAFLHGMYQRLLAGRIVLPAKDKTFNQFSWTDLTTMVYEQVSAMVNNMQKAEEKIRHFEAALRMKEEGSEEAHRSHEDQLNKLTSLTKERENTWQKQKEEIEAHYTQLMAEMQARTKKSQAMADQAWEKIRMTGSVQQGLETECAELQTKLAETQQQNSSLLAACALLCGAFYPLCSRANQLSLQRHIMEDQIMNWDMCRERAELLVNTLNTEMKERDQSYDSQKSHQSKRNLMLVFRVGVVTVLAANRIRRLGHGCVRTFVTYDSSTGLNNLLVCTGGAKLPVMPEQADSDESEDLPDRQSPGETSLLQWLSSTELMNTMTSSTTELLEVMSQVKSKDKVGSVETRALVSAARSSFTRLFDRMGRYYEGITVRPDVGFRERSSLVRQLGRGLNKYLKGKTVEEKSGFASPQDLMIALQNHILDFTQRLHSVELERRSLIQEVNALRQENEKLGLENEPLLDDESDLPATEHGKDYVSMDKFESVCLELNNALKREQEAQQLLHEQSKQLEEISVKLDLFSSEGMEKEHTLTEAIQGLAETKMDLKKKEQTVRQMNKQLAHVEGERKSLQENLYDAEKALRTVARDKDILTSYIKAVESALEQAKRQMGKHPGSKTDIPLSKLLLNADFIPSDIGKAGPELIACQNLVGTFIDTHHEAFARMKSLEDEIDIHKQHVTTLKRELSDAVRRELNGEYEPPTRDVGGRVIIQPPPEADISHRDAFQPLREDSELSFTITKPVTPKSFRMSSVSPKKSERSPKYITPHRLVRRSRPRSYEPGGR